MVRLTNTKTYLLHLNAKDETFRRSAELRKTMTRAEKILWAYLKNRKLNGLKFRRQHPIHFYIADFYCHELKLIIEVDGSVHDVESVHNHDENRKGELERFDITIIRFSNKEIENNIESVIGEIIKCTDTIKAKISSKNG